MSGQPAGVRASRRPLRGLLSMRFFLCATKALPHPEERERAAPGRASRRTHRGHPAGTFLWSFPAGAITYPGLDSQDSPGAPRQATGIMTTALWVIHILLAIALHGLALPQRPHGRAPT